MRIILALIFSAATAFAGEAAPTLALIEAAILAAEAESLPEGSRLDLYLPEDAPEEAAKLILHEHDLQKTSFIALIETAEGLQLPLRGRVFAVIDVPVPRAALSAGHILTADDFELRTLPVSALGRFALSDLDQLIGHEVRRLLPEGRMVQSQSVQAPRAVRRGDKITLTYQSGPLQLSAPARALEDAAEGDSLRVQNLSSNKTVTAIALGKGRVQVSP